MEPIHYLRALRRRWWVIAAAVLVAGTAAWATIEVAPVQPVTPPKSAGYSATTVLWNPGAPIVGQGSPITDLTVLANLVGLPEVSSIAAKRMHFPGSPLDLSQQVYATTDPTTGFLSITGTAPNPATAEGISKAFSRSLIVYLVRLRNTKIDQQQQLVQEQIQRLIQRGGSGPVVAALRSQLSQLALDRTAPISLTVLRHVPAEPAPVVGPPAEQGGFKFPKSRNVRVLLASLFGLLAGIALALVLERFDTRIRSARLAEEAFGVPVLAEVPAIARRRRDRPVTHTHPYSRAAGAFRLLCVATQRWTSGGAGPRAMTLVVTSPEARDGKTTVAANLAVAYAQTGRRVLVVSADLRRPSIHETFGVSDRPGLVDLLEVLKSADPDAPLDISSYLVPCSVVRVAVLPSGSTPELPGELLGSDGMKRLLQRLGRITDIVILDCAPLVVASDVVPLLPQVDGVVLVARARSTRQALAASTAALVERMGAKHVGVVLNDAREFSIPLAKRRMYRPTREMRRAGKGRPAEDAVPTTLEPMVLEPVAEPEPVARSRSPWPRSPSPWPRSPSPWSRSPSPCSSSRNRWSSRSPSPWPRRRRSSSPNPSTRRRAGPRSKRCSRSSRTCVPSSTRSRWSCRTCPRTGTELGPRRPPTPTREPIMAKGIPRLARHRVDHYCLTSGEVHALLS